VQHDNIIGMPAQRNDSPRKKFANGRNCLALLRDQPCTHDSYGNLAGTLMAYSYRPGAMSGQPRTSVEAARHLLTADTVVLVASVAVNGTSSGQGRPPPDSAGMVTGRVGIGGFIPAVSRASALAAQLQVMEIVWDPTLPW
jgi:hypothetical protein